MFTNEEKTLEALHKKMDHVQIPEVRLDEAILRGIHRGKLEAPKRKKGVSWNWRAGLAQAAVVLLLFVLSIRYLDGFAAVVRGIPGMENLVSAIRDEPSLQEAIDNHFLQEIGLSDEHDGIKFTVHSVLADEKRMILFYSIETDQEFNELTVRPELIDKDGNKMDQGYAMSVWSVPEPHKSKGKLYQIEFTFTDIEVPEEFLLEVHISEYRSELPGEWKIPIQLDRSVFAGQKKEFVLNQTFDFEGQKVTVRDITIYPTRTEIDVMFDEKNSKQVFDIEDLRLVDEKGEFWSGHPGSLSATGLQDYMTFYLESNYFRHPKHLSLQFSKLQALDKDELDLVIDPAKAEIIKRPSVGPELSVKREGSLLLITIHDVPDDFHHFVIEKVTDSAGNELNRNSMGVAETGKDMIFHVPYNDKTVAPGPIRIRMNGFPSYIYGDANIPLY
ncbi:MAG TPA: DUF4179 domain-containing protein [Bacillus sp. (in: firmicutes)]|uniref:DUF4179 domain-containing protein n=1 Tax=Bacillus litorisediminis TaxID=2922713 RepID=UPI001FAD903B|nr:DUF4179 domain-containing protein [Bacillus litorisediminis]HWO75753.1 DUF4179 domain-containing protein [Bacillus sp. (in: firmicutes)]